MLWEVEQKFAVSNPTALLIQLRQLGCAVAEAAPNLQVDRYFAHPCRDFAATDEALRLRTDAGGTRITYKGPKIDSTTKTRREIELPLGGTTDEIAAWPELLGALGFRLVAAVEKRRRTAACQWSGREFEISLDDVINVGEYVEIELTADDAGLETSRQSLLDFANFLGLSASERRSYLELLLAR